MLGIAYRGVAFPLLFSLLDKRGNSNCEERIQLVNRFIRLFGIDCIDCIMADRETEGSLIPLNKIKNRSNLWEKNGLVF